MINAGWAGCGRAEASNRAKLIKKKRGGKGRGRRRSWRGEWRSSIWRRCGRSSPSPPGGAGRVGDLFPVIFHLVSLCSDIGLLLHQLGAASLTDGSLSLICSHFCARSLLSPLSLSRSLSLSNTFLQVKSLYPWGACSIAQVTVRSACQPLRLFA